MSLEIQGNSKDYAIGAGAGLVAGAAAGYASKNVAVGKKLTEQIANAKLDYTTGFGAFQQKTLTQDVLDKTLAIAAEAAQDKKAVKLAEKLVENPDKKGLAEKLEARIADVSAKIINKPENKELKEVIDNTVKSYNEGEGKDLFGKVQELGKKAKNHKIAWVAGIAAAGVAIGTGIAYAINKVQAGKAESQATEDKQATESESAE